MQFPTAHRISAGVSRYRLSEIEKYEAALTGETPPDRSAGGERWLTVRQVADRFGTHKTTIWRWSAASEVA